MRKVITLTVILLMATSLGAAADRHGPLKTGLFEVHPGDEAPDGEEVSEGTDIIYGKYASAISAIEKGEYREGNEAKHEKQAWATGGKDGGAYSASIANGHDGNPQTGEEIQIPARAE